LSFSAEFDVRFGDIDQAHVVYYPRFFHYFHQAFERWFGEALGVTYPQLVNDHRIGFPSVRVETEFMSPLRYGDRQRITLDIDDIGRRSLTIRYAMHRVGDEVLCARAKITTVAINHEFKSVDIPEWLRERFENYRAETGGAD
jgi:4-hydroxybenzoyl-CoA thioesterase